MPEEPVSDSYLFSLVLSKMMCSSETK